MRNTNERRQAILELLCDIRFEKISNIMVEFNVSRSTIIRDLQLLSVNYPIYTVQGRSGGVHIVEGYSLGRKYLKPVQIELLNRLADSTNEHDRKVINDILSSFTVSLKLKKTI